MSALVGADGAMEAVPSRWGIMLLPGSPLRFRVRFLGYAG